VHVELVVKTREGELLTRLAPKGRNPPRVVPSNPVGVSYVNVELVVKTLEGGKEKKGGR